VQGSGGRKKMRDGPQRRRDEEKNKRTEAE
jgi:hypothetical protein